MLRILLIFSVLFSGLFFSQNKLNLIPYPQKVKFQQGEFMIPDNFILDKNLPKQETEYFKKHFEKGFLFKYGNFNDAHLTESLYPPKLSHLPTKEEPKKEKYSVHISAKNIVINSNTRQGYFLALQTLIQ